MSHSANCWDFWCVHYFLVKPIVTIYLFLTEKEMQSYSLKRNKNYFRIILVRYIVYGKHTQHRGSEKPLKKFVVLMYIYIYCLFKYKCCGVNNYTDWQGVYDIHNFKTLPDSCCGYSGCGQSGAQVSYLIVSIKSLFSSDFEIFV